MKKNLLRFPGAMLLSLIATSGFSQIVGTDAFLQSDYIEMGMNTNGVYISDAPPPAGYQTAVSGYRGLISDSDKDGWTTGTPNYCGDYFAPGSPVEGFAVQADGNYYYNTYTMGAAAGSVINYNNTVSAVNAMWRGTIAANGLQITQITSVPHGGTIVITSVQLKNTSAVTINNVFYSRNADPDNDADITFDFNTNNIIVQNHPTDPWAIVSAEGAVCYLAMASMQSNAVASYGGFATENVLPQYAYLGSSPWAVTGTHLGDEAIQMNFRIGKINAGQTKVLNFIYGTNESDIADYIEFTGDEVAHKMENDLNGVSSQFTPEFRISPNPSSGLINLYGYGMSSTSTVELQIMDMLGQIISSTQLENSNGITSAQFELDNTLPNGTYFANFMVDGKSFAQPFVLSR